MSWITILQLVLPIRREVSRLGTSFESVASRTCPKAQDLAYRSHLEDMVRRRAFASMAVWAAPKGCAIALLASSFGHLIPFNERYLEIQETI